MFENGANLLLVLILGLKSRPKAMKAQLTLKTALNHAKVLQYEATCPRVSRPDNFFKFAGLEINKAVTVTKAIVN